MKNLLFIWMIIVASFMLSTCGGGGGSGDGSGGFLDVRGRYSFNTENYRVVCSNGENFSSSSSSFNLTVSQSGSSISFVANVRSDSDVEILKSPTGQVEGNGDFIIDAEIRGESDGTSIIASYNWDGAFTTNGWSGEYKVTALFLDLQVICMSTTNFTGRKFLDNEDSNDGGGSENESDSVESIWG